ncbi:uncharacterized protein PG986_004507 [Apiospora aurea]|uniref:T6SS Phospholipase effector Tle1-like catalytic domain-containing protein n=1 Tax=Apiospora aurea TaxID=335848 RepID=A0ABR1QMS5_9PEZI
MSTLPSLSSQDSGCGSRQPRLHFVSFNGTWAGGVLSCRKTVVSEFVTLISAHENVFETPINGVGSDIGFIDRIVGGKPLIHILKDIPVLRLTVGAGLGGWGTLRNVITAFRNLAGHYAAEDRIILVGYSRGAWAARYLAMLIDVLGLPRDGDERLYNTLYKACHRDTIITQEAAQQMLQGYERWTGVKIDALCCFDTVGSLGLPLTGLAKPLAILGARKRNNVDVVSDVASNVKYAFHCLSLHETREPFSPTLMCGPGVHQVSFPGSHGSLGWIEETEGLVHAPFAWMIQQLHTHLNISFDKTQLAKHFPGYAEADTPVLASAGTPTVSSLTGQPRIHGTATKASSTETLISAPYAGRLWSHGDIMRANTELLAIIGKKGRNPGHITSAGKGASLKVHIGARLRNAGVASETW